MYLARGQKRQQTQSSYYGSRKHARYNIEYTMNTLGIARFIWNLSFLHTLKPLSEIKIESVKSQYVACYANDQFKTMSDNQQYSINHGVTVSGHLKLALVDIASCVERMGLPIDPNFEKDEHNQMERRLIIHDMQIKDPFTMTAQNKGHTARTRFGNATRIMDFYCRLTSEPFNFFAIFKHISAI